MLSAIQDYAATVDIGVWENSGIWMFTFAIRWMFQRMAKLVQENS